MAQLHIAENIVELRHKKKITQDELAAFLGVTKASVSKWETKQSYPDILLLPQIAAYFDIDIDTLLGYEPQLSREQIKKLYHNLATDFSERPFDEVMERSKQLVKEYYSCYPFLLQILILWLNHFMLGHEDGKSNAVLQDILALCSHIEQGCGDAGICKDVQAIKAMVHLQRNELDEVIEILQPFYDPMHMNMESPICLIQAYAMKKESEKADALCQLAIYQDILQMISHSIVLLSLHMQNMEYGRKTIERVDGLLSIYDIDELHPNTASQFYYQCALFYCGNSQEEQAISYLKRFVKACDRLLEQGIRLHGDAYFYRLEEWIEEAPLGAQGVRNALLVQDSIMQALENPMLEGLKKSFAYQAILTEAKRKRGTIV